MVKVKISHALLALGQGLEAHRILGTSLLGWQKESFSRLLATPGLNSEPSGDFIHHNQVAVTTWLLRIS